MMALVLAIFPSGLPSVPPKNLFALAHLTNVETNCANLTCLPGERPKDIFPW